MKKDFKVAGFYKICDFFYQASAWYYYFIYFSWLLYSVQIYSNREIMISNIHTHKSVNQEVKRKKTRKNGYREPFTMRKITSRVECKKDLQERFKQFNKQQLCKSVMGTFLNIFGKHNPVNYKDSFGFKQQWQLSKDEKISKQYEENTILLLLNIFRILLLGFSIWSTSINIFFPIPSNFWVPSILLLCTLLQLIKHLIMFSFHTKSEKIIEFLQISAILVYSISLLTFASNEANSIFSRIVGVIIILQLYLKLTKSYSQLKNYHISSSYRDMVNLFDLFLFLIAITHIFGCVLYITSQLSPNQNWLTNKGIYEKDWIQKYIYSLYFSATTLLTVGYGDLAPTNVPEILAILITEFFGIAIFGYTVNKIGTALSNVQEKNEKLQKDLGTVEKFGKSCRLEPEVICKMRTQVINSKQLGEDLCVQEQNDLVKNFSQDLRQKIKFESNIKVLKRSLFFITNWTGNFQNKIARRLIKELYKAEEVLPQSVGKQKLYILDKGKIEILNSSKSSIQKVLKSLNVEQDEEIIVDNVYGYSAVISSSNINLNAVARETTICYTLSKADFIQILNECEEDKQHFHEIKNKIEFTKIPQQIQVPSIVNIRQHYRPSTQFIIFRKKKLERIKNERKKYDRNNKKVEIKIIPCSANYMNRRESDANQSINILTIQKSRFKQSQEKPQRRKMKLAVDQNWVNSFEAMKSYERYFKKSNYESIVSRIKFINFVRKPLKIQSNTVLHIRKEAI